MNHRISGILLMLILGLVSTAQSQATDTDQCDKASQLYEQQAGQCADYNQQLADLRTRIIAFKKNRDMFLAACRTQSSQKECDELAESYSGRLSILEQDYAVRASHGCQRVPFVSVTNACKTTPLTKQALAKNPETGVSTMPAKVPSGASNGAVQAKITPARVPAESGADHAVSQPTNQRVSNQSGSAQTPRSTVTNNGVSRTEFSTGGNGMSGAAAQATSGRTAGNSSTQK